MCDLTAYLKKQGKEELLLESVNSIRVQNGEVLVRNLFGEEKRVRGTVSEVSLIKNRVIVEAS
jgi:predicted RNA-binding protein